MIITIVKFLYNKTPTLFSTTGAMTKDETVHLIKPNTILIGNF